MKLNETKLILIIVLFFILGLATGLYLMKYWQHEYVATAYNFVKLNCQNITGVKIG